MKANIGGSTQSRLIGELWTLDELADAKHAWSTMLEGVDCFVPFDRMKALQKRGLLSDLSGGQREYQYFWTTKLERLIKAICRRDVRKYKSGRGLPQSKNKRNVNQKV